MQQLLPEKLDREVLVPEDPQLIGALGAVLLAYKIKHEGQGEDVEPGAVLWVQFHDFSDNK